MLHGRLDDRLEDVKKTFKQCTKPKHHYTLLNPSPPLKDNHGNKSTPQLAKKKKEGCEMKTHQSRRCHLAVERLLRSTSQSTGQFHTCRLTEKKNIFLQELQEANILIRVAQEKLDPHTRSHTSSKNTESKRQRVMHQAHPRVTQLYGFMVKSHSGSPVPGKK